MELEQNSVFLFKKQLFYFYFKTKIEKQVNKILKAFFGKFFLRIRKIVILFQFKVNIGK